MEELKTRHLGEYDHLNSSEPIEFGPGVKIVDIDAFARKIVEANYGTHRLLSALIRARRSSDKHNRRENPLTKRLIELLEEGLC